MDGNETHALGYKRVDDDPNIEVLISTMDATASWEATRRLRAWERQHLSLQPGQRLLDVGCGLGDAALGLGVDLHPDGEVVGLDASAEMVARATSKARGSRCRVRFAVGDALALDEADDGFDVVRCERTLQWLPDPGKAVAEMARVVRPGGLVSIIDTDWSTLRVDVGDGDIGQRVRDAMRSERRRPSNVGRRLPELAAKVCLVPVAQTRATQHWTDWDPDASPAPQGCFSMSSLADDLVDAGHLAPGDQQLFVSAIHDAARHGRFSMDLTMFAVIAKAPAIDRPHRAPQDASDT